MYVNNGAAQAVGPRQVILTTTRLQLTSWLREDSQDLHAVHSDAETTWHVRSGRPESLAEVEELVDRYVAEQTSRGWTNCDWLIAMTASWAELDSAALTSSGA